MSAWLVTYFADIFIFYLQNFFNGRHWNNEFSGSTGQITKFSGLVERCEDLINFTLIWRSLKGRSHDNQLYSQNRHFWQTNVHCRTAVLK